MRRFGIVPKIAICTQSEFGNLQSTSGATARAAMKILDSEK